MHSNSLVAECKENGDFKEIQCQGSQCYCVNKDGREVQGTRTSNGKKPKCPDVGEYFNVIYMYVYLYSYVFLHQEA